MQRIPAMMQVQDNLTCVMDEQYLNHNPRRVDFVLRLYLPVGLWPSIALGLFFQAIGALQAQLVLLRPAGTARQLCKTLKPQALRPLMRHQFGRPPEIARFA
jgi:hypothetical protein